MGGWFGHVSGWSLYRGGSNSVATSQPSSSPEEEILLLVECGGSEQKSTADSNENIVGG